jgi:hypothetical protein
VPVSLAVTSPLSRLLLAAACVAIGIAALAMLKAHKTDHELVAYRASRVAGAATLLCVAALSLALYVSPGS